MPMPALADAAGLAHNSFESEGNRMYVADLKRLTHDGARKMMATAIDKAREAKIAVSCCIVDAGGHVVVLERMDGGRFHTLHSCTTKAVTSASNKRADHGKGRGRPGPRRDARARASRSPQARSAGPRWRAASRCWWMGSASVASASAAATGQTDLAIAQAAVEVDRRELE